jgi:maltose 6'-phosphate phosphatase
MPPPSLRQRHLVLAAAAAFCLAFGPADCGVEPLDDDGLLKIMTLNQLFLTPTSAAPIPPVDDATRLDVIADFVLDNEVDCLLSQEVVGGALAEHLGLSATLNSALDLKGRLGDDYWLQYQLANGIPAVFSVGNAIYCRRSIRRLQTFSMILPIQTEVVVDGIEVPLRRKIMGALLEVPDFGKLLLFNVHVCATCDPEERHVQIGAAVGFVEMVMAWTNLLHGRVPTVFGGDFNIHDPLEGEEQYDLIVGAGFRDTYSAVHCGDSFICCDPDDHDENCTFAVNGNPFALGPTGGGGPPARVDYIFASPDLSGNILDSYVVFDGSIVGDHFVSDHSAVCTEFEPGPRE